MSFAYLLARVKDAPLETFPFRHLHLTDFLSAAHFAALTSAPEIAISNLKDDDALFEALFESGYRIIEFPGCVTDRKEYIDWHKRKPVTGRVNTACEGFGVAFRLTRPKTPLVSELVQFLEDGEFQSMLAEKFGVDPGAVFRDSGIQKYLDGYEISPHPDMRKKALTFMVNVNPDANSPALDHHTHYLQFTDRYKYVQAYWDGNPEQDRCWVPWDWCVTRKIQTENNSIVAFSPGNDTLHGVKAQYDHLASQRTQIYGNLWYNSVDTKDEPAWENFVFDRKPQSPREPRELLKSLVPAPMRRAMRTALRGTFGDSIIRDRSRRD